MGACWGRTCESSFGGGEPKVEPYAGGGVVRVGLERWRIFAGGRGRGVSVMANMVGNKKLDRRNLQCKKE